MTRPYTPALNPSGGSPQDVAHRINAILQGKINSIGTITLQENSAATTLNDPNIGLESGVGLFPMSANAKAEGMPWFQIPSRGTATLNHTNNAQTDRTYFYLIVG